MTGTLFIVATPIGNLEDITIRAIKTLQEADIVLAEDTRVTQKLLAFVNSKLQIPNYKLDNNDLTHNSPPITHYPQLISYHQHSSEERKLEILKNLMDGKNIALVTDAGTPGISDPGNELISFLTTNYPQLAIVPIPGPSAITSALSVSGFDTSKFVFLGFWPKKKAKKTLDLIKNTKLNVVFYESPFRILKTLGLLEKELGSDTKIVVARELTKMHETIYRGTFGSVLESLQKGGNIKGEIVVVLEFSK